MIPTAPDHEKATRGIPSAEHPQSPLRGEHVHVDAFHPAQSQWPTEGENGHGLGVMEKLGLKSIRTIMLTTLAMAAAVSFLGFLWWIDRSNITWRKIVLHNWLPRSVTLCCVVIRFALTAQAAIATSILAALALERQRPLLHLSASLSVMRFVNTGPSSMVSMIFKDRSGIGHFPIWPTTILLACTTALSQFSSTILLSDFHGGHVIGTLQNTSTLSGYRTIVPSWSPQVDYWNIVPQSYPTFAEYSEAPNVEDGLDDTGLTLRTLFPIFSQSSRSLLRSFRGNATVIDSRVTCVRPQFADDRLTIQWTADASSGAANSYVSGAVTPERDVPRLVNSGGNNSATPFKCTFMPTDSQFDNTTPWVLSLCTLGRSAGGLLSELDPYHNTSMQYCFDDDGGWQIATSNGSCPTDRYAYTPPDLDSAIAFFDPPMLGSAYMVLNISRVSFGDFPSQNSSNWDFNDWVFDSTGPWTEAKLSDPPIQIQSTLCFDALQSFDLSVFVFSNANRTEPYVGYDSYTANFTTETVRSQLGTFTNETFDQRGILSLKTEPKDLRDQVSVFYPSTNLGEAPTPFVVGKVLPSSKTTSALFCPRCQPMFDTLDNFTTVVNPQQASTFRDILLNTSRPALAVQAHFTTLTRMAYYDNLPIFDYPGSQLSDFFTPASVPTTYSGFAIVMALIVLHLALVGSLIVMFVREAHSTRLANVWHTVAQLNSEETHAVLRGASLASDRQVKEWIEADGAVTRRVTLGNDSGRNGRVEISRTQA